MAPVPAADGILADGPPGASLISRPLPLRRRESTHILACANQPRRIVRKHDRDCGQTAIRPLGYDVGWLKPSATPNDMKNYLRGNFKAFQVDPEAVQLIA